MYILVVKLGCQWLNNWNKHKKTDSCMQQNAYLLVHYIYLKHMVISNKQKLI